MRVTGTIITQLSHISPYSCVKTCTDGHCRYECCQLVYTLSKYPFHSFDLHAEAIPTRLNPEPICRHAWLAAGACLLLAFVTAAEQRTLADPLLTGLINAVVLKKPEIQAAQAAVEVAAGPVSAADQPLFNPEVDSSMKTARSI